MCVPNVVFVILIVLYGRVLLEKETTFTWFSNQTVFSTGTKKRRNYWRLNIPYEKIYHVDYLHYPPMIFVADVLWFVRWYCMPYLASDCKFFSHIIRCYIVVVRSTGFSNLIRRNVRSRYQRSSFVFYFHLVNFWRVFKIKATLEGSLFKILFYAISEWLRSKLSVTSFVSISVDPFYDHSSGKFEKN